MNARQFLLFVFVTLSSLSLKAQYLNGNSTVNLGNNVMNNALNSGGYMVGIPQTGHPNQVNSKYLFTIRRNNTSNHQFQISSGSMQDDKLYFRKVYAATNETVNSQWHEVATRGANIFTASQRVNGRVYANGVIVQSTVWADFVFDDDYELPSLNEVESHIKENRHLPGIPTAKEVTENGVDLGEMNVKLLQKVEELTLYTIRQQSLINEMQKEIQDMKSRFSE